MSMSILIKRCDFSSLIDKGRWGNVCVSTAELFVLGVDVGVFSLKEPQNNMLRAD